MKQDSRRITLISRDPSHPDRDWDNSGGSRNRMVLLDSFFLLRSAISSQLVQLDVERVILDRATSAGEYLTLLASLPPTFNGDVILIREGDEGFLSATGRGGGRVLYALSASDVRFYLEMHGLVTGCVAIGKISAMPVLEWTFPPLRAVV
ncbi:MAG TPA: hypothetical protein VM779_07575 [Thermoanaerobaculia bacterium]|nr:hypothetical protein [Thermoanaerobaculia bacterium]